MPSSDRDDDELSDSARAVLRIQQEIDGGVSDEAPKKSSSRAGNGRTHGAVTGIALGEYADSPKASKASKASNSGTVQIKAKGSKALVQTSYLQRR